jgi:hypothetical protein
MVSLWRLPVGRTARGSKGLISLDINHVIKDHHDGVHVRPF